MTYTEWETLTGLRLSRDDKLVALAMLQPVVCRCGEIYDLGSVRVTGRSADCSVWVTPCCKRTVDDRPPYPGGRSQFRKIDKGELRC